MTTVLHFRTPATTRPKVLHSGPRKQKSDNSSTLSVAFPHGTSFAVWEISIAQEQLRLRLIKACLGPQLHVHPRAFAISMIRGHLANDTCPQQGYTHSDGQRDSKAYSVSLDRNSSNQFPRFTSLQVDEHIKTQNWIP